MNPLSMLLWVALPYAGIAVFVVGHIWRYRYDKFGWTTRSSQTYENTLLRWGSPMFHLGILMVIAGHVVGLLIPREWLYAIGIGEHMYHLGATWLGTAAAILTLAGLAILTRTELLVVILGGLFVAITLSVIIQVASFKTTGKRVFRMAPLQHHFELLGWQEVTIVIRFWIVAGLFVALGLGLFYAEWVVGAA